MNKRHLDLQPNRQSLRARNKMAGGAVIELALFLPFLLVLLFGVVDFARAVHFDNILVHISREGANLSSRTAQPTQNIVNVLAQTAEPLDFANDGMIHITTIVGLPNGLGQIQSQARSAQGNLGMNSRIWQCPAWNANNTCQINGAGPTIDLGVRLNSGEVVQAVEAQYDYDMMINFITDQGPELYALTIL
jgi:Flp pilus assembly protein TadG